MSRLRIAGAVVVATCVLALSGASSFAAVPQKAMKDHIIVKITTSNGNTWGKVTPKWKGSNGKEVMGMVCRTSKCSYYIPHMTRITLSEAPTHPNTWPFKHWTLSGAAGHMMTMKNKTLTFEAGKTNKATATAVYAPM